MRFNLWILVLLLFNIPANAQQDIPRFRNYSTLDGLSQGWVRCIYQDDLGYMWFGTADGLNRYDGYEFKVFYTNPKNKYSIGSTYINNIIRKNSKEIWICAHNGVYYYNQDLERFYKFQKLPDMEARIVFEDSKKYIWFGTANGLYRFNPADSSMKSYHSNYQISGSISNNNIQYIFEDSKKNLWISTYTGIDLYNWKTDSFVHIDISKFINKQSRTRVWEILEDKSGRLWLGIKQGGIYLFNYNSTNPQLSTLKCIVECSPNCMVIDNDSNLWVGNGGSLGLKRFRIKGFKEDQLPVITSYTHNEYWGHTISSNSISSIYKDRFGDIWMGTYGGGVDFYSKRAKKFETVSFSKEVNSISSNLVNTILEEEKYLWIGTEQGLDRMDKQTKEIVHYTNQKQNPLSIGADAIYELYKDSKGNLWIGSWNGGLSKYDYATGTFKNFKPDNKQGSISNANVFSICEDQKGYLWIGTNGGGLNKFDPKTEKFTAFLTDEKKYSSIRHNSVNDVFVSHDGKIWVSLYGAGMDVYDETTNSFTHYINNPNDSSSISPGFILSIFEDSKSNIWIASSMGLNLYNPQNNTFRHFTIDDGLPNNTIQAILEDNKGNLWLSTNNGIVLFYDAINKPTIPRFKIYNKKDGLTTNEFSVRSAFRNKEGLFYFGSSQGYVLFNPANIKDNVIPPIVVLTDFGLLETIDTRTPKSSLYTIEINSVKTIELDYTQSDFTIKFAALNYLSSEKNQFKYRLEGYEEGWHFVGNQRFATYTNIQPGEYNFMVYGSNNDGIWSENPKTIKIKILPPWWETSIFRIFLTVLILLFVFAVFKIRTSILEKQKRILQHTVEERTNELRETNILLEEKNEEIEIQNDELSQHRNSLEELIKHRTAELEEAKLKAEESDRLKSAFLANMSHEIRTPMNAIVGFANLLDESNLQEEDKQKFIKMININSETLMVLIDDIIDISLIESNQLVFKPSIFNAHKILKELEIYYNLRNVKKLHIEFVNKHEDKLLVELDQVRFWQILNNLINNAVKYTERGSITFGYEKTEAEIRFFVKDTGIGIEPEHFETIFNHFNKIENKDRGYQRGAGIGLAICKSLISKMGGKIWLESQINDGSTFYFTIPYVEIHEQTNGNSYLKNVHLYFKNTKIVIAEDEPANYELLYMYLRNFGVEIFWAKNGLECVNHINSLNSRSSVIVLMDIKMPVMDGYEAMHQIKKIDEKIPVIAITAYAQLSDKDKILSEGFNDYLSKPVRKETLLKTLSRFVSLK